MKKVAALFLAIAMCACLLACGKDEMPNESQPVSNTGTPTGNESEPGEATAPATESMPSTPALTESELTLTNDLADLIVSIDGSVYQLPCTVQSLLDDGWQLDLGKKSDTQEINPSRDISLHLYRGEKDEYRGIYVVARNLGDSACPINECTIVRIAAVNLVSDSAEAIFAGDFQLSEDLTLDDIIAQYGEGTPKDQMGDIWYHYGFERGYYVFAIEDNHLSWWQITCREHYSS